MKTLARIQVKKLNIKDLIKNSHLNNELKKWFLTILPNMDKNQINEIYNFIDIEEKKILNLEQKIEQDELKFYQKIFKKANNVLEREKKEIRIISEWNELKKDEKMNLILLKELDNL